MVTTAHKGELKMGFESFFCHHTAALAMISFKYSGSILCWLPVPWIILTAVGYFYICATSNWTACSRIIIGVALHEEEPYHLKANGRQICITGNIEFVAVAHLFTRDFFFFFLKAITLFLRHTKRFSVVADNN